MNMFFDESTRLSDACAEQRMYPAPVPLSKYGFLSREENLQQRIAEDIKIMADLHIDCDRIAKRIEEIFASTGEFWNGNGLLRVEYIAGMICPWNEFISSNMLSMIPEVREIIVIHRDKFDEAAAIVEKFDNPRGGINTDCYLALVKADVAMILSDLHPHLLREHKFCQGLETPYRVAPERVKDYLGDM